MSAGSNVEAMKDLARHDAAKIKRLKREGKVTIPKERHSVIINNKTRVFFSNKKRMSLFDNNERYDRIKNQFKKEVS